MRDRRSALSSGGQSGLAMIRARQALGAAGLDPGAELTRASSVTNEVWLTDQHVIRVNRHPDGRLMREARLAPSLPAEVKCPEIIGCDSGAGFDWLVIARRPGAVLSRAWPAMPPSQRRVAVRQLAFMLKTLHETPRPDDLAPIEEPPQLLTADESMEPTAPLLDALAQMSLLKHVDEELVGELRSFVWSKTKVLKPYPSSTLIHGDVTFENVLWDGQEVTALIDYEWARGAPRDVDLDVLLRFCAYPKLHVAEDYEDETRAVDYEDVPSWLAEDYRELFGFHDEVDRVRLFAISYDVRELLAFPPAGPMYDLPEHHALRRLGRTLSGMSYIDAFGATTRQLRS